MSAFTEEETVNLRVDSYVAMLLDDAFTMYIDSRQDPKEGFEALLGLLHYSDAEFILFVCSKVLVKKLSTNKEILTPLDLEAIFEDSVKDLEIARAKIANVLNKKKSKFIEHMKNVQAECIEKGILED